MSDDREGLARWCDFAGDLDSHTVSSLRRDLGMASCGLSNPRDEEVERLREVADEEGLEMHDSGSGAMVRGGSNFTVRDAAPEGEADE